MNEYWQESALRPNSKRRQMAKWLIMHS